MKNQMVRKFSLGLGVALILGLSSHAKGSFNIGTAVNYGVITGPSVGNISLTGTSVTGNFGVDTYLNNLTTSNSLSPGNTVYGDFNIHDGSGQSASSIKNIVLISGNLNTSDSAVSTAYNSLSNISSQDQGQTGTTINAGTGPQTILASSGHLDTTDGSEVFTTTAAAFLNNPLTISGDGSHSVVINVTGGNVNLANSLYLTGGITADQVFINIVNNYGSTVQNTSGNTNTINAIVFASGDTINLSNTYITGILAGGGNGTFTLSNDIVGVPEPSSLAMVLIAGGLATGVTAYRKRASKQAKTA